MAENRATLSGVEATEGDAALVRAIDIHRAERERLARLSDRPSEHSCCAILKRVQEVAPALVSALRHEVLEEWEAFDDESGEAGLLRWEEGASWRR